MSKQPSHPFIGFVVKQIDEIYELMAYDPGSSPSAMLKFIHICGPDVRMKETWKDLEQELRNTVKDRMGIQGEFPMDTENKKASFDGLMIFSYLDFLSRLTAIVWEAGYFNEMTFQGFYDPSGGRKSGEKTL